MRRIQIKIWPEIDAQYPAIIPVERIKKNKSNPVDIDFKNANKVSSSGLVILLINLIKIANDLTNRLWDTIPPQNQLIDKLISDLNFYKLWVLKVPNANLFWQNISSQEINLSPIKSENDNGEIMTIFPIYELNFCDPKIDKRQIVEDFKEYLIKNLFYLQEIYDFELSIFIQILIEMAKNSGDHTDDNAYFGLDVYQTSKKIQIKFSFGDLGVGINQSIRKFIKQDSTFKDKARHLALTDSYHYALRVGTTTKPDSNINKGIGMSTIFNLTKQMDFDLSVYDAESRGFLSYAGNNSHVELRKVFYSIGFKVGFYYYGEIEIKL